MPESSFPRDDVGPDAVQRILNAHVGGADCASIGEVEGLALAQVEAVVREALERKRVAPLPDFVKLQIARLERLSLNAFDRAERGELGAVDRTLKILDRFDRYHGFSRLAPATLTYGEDERARLLAKLNAIAARLDADAAGAESP